MQVEITVSELGRLGPHELVDIRTGQEVAREPLPCAHVHIPMDELLARPQLLSMKKTWVLVCAAGIRTRAAATMLRAQGYEAYSLAGGRRALKPKQ